MDGYDRLILCSPLIAVGFFVPASGVFLRFSEVSATECSKCSEVLLFRHNLISAYPVKALKTLGNQYRNGLKTLQVKRKAVYSFLFKLSD